MSNCHFGAHAVFNGPVNFSADGDVAGRDFHHQPTTNYYAAPGGGYRGLPQLLQQVEVNGEPAPHQVLYDANGAGNLCLYDCMRWMFDPLKSPDRIKAELLDLLSDTVQGKYGDVMQQRQITSLCALHNEGDVGFRPPRPETYVLDAHGKNVYEEYAFDASGHIVHDEHTGEPIRGPAKVLVEGEAANMQMALEAVAYLRRPNKMASEAVFNVACMHFGAMRLWRDAGDVLVAANVDPDVKDSEYVGALVLYGLHYHVVGRCGVQYVRPPVRGILDHAYPTGYGHLPLRAAHVPVHR